jgi:hypothetical protein
MDAYGRPQGRRRNARQACDGGGRGSGGRGSGRHGSGTQTGDGGPGAYTATRALVAVGAYVVHDLSDPDGVARPLLRRAALRMVASRRDALRRIGGVYLQRDPPAPEELTGRSGSEPLQLPPGQTDPPAAGRVTGPSGASGAV